MIFPFRLSAAILADPKTEGATFVHVDPSGQWRLAPEEAVDNQGATTQASAPEVPHSPMNGPTLIPLPSLAAVPAKTSPNRSPSRLVNGNAEETPNPPNLFSPIKAAPIENVSPLVPSNDNQIDIEVIVLSDDDDEDENTKDKTENQTHKPSDAFSVRVDTEASDLPRKEASVGLSQTIRPSSDTNQRRNPEGLSRYFV